MQYNKKGIAMNRTVEIELNTNNIIVLEEEKAVEFCTQEYFKGNDKLKINGRKFDIFNFGDFKEKLYCN